jgi:hypothetical protein
VPICEKIAASGPEGTIGPEEMDDLTPTLKIARRK